MIKFIAADGEYEGYHTFTVKDTFEEAVQYLEEQASEFPGVSYVAVFEIDTTNNTWKQLRIGEQNYKTSTIDWEE